MNYITSIFKSFIESSFFIFIKNNFFSITALLFSLYNFFKAKPKLNFYFNDNAYPVASVYFLDNQNNIVIDKVSGENVYLIHCTIRNYSTKEHYIPSIHVTDDKNNRISKYADMSMILNNNEHIVLDLENENLGNHYMKFIREDHFFIPAQSVFELNLLVIIPPNTEYVDFKIEKPNETFISMLLNTKFGVRLSKSFEKKPERIHKYEGKRYFLK